MVRLGANLSMLFCERPLVERPGAARAAGFEAVEFQFLTPAEARILAPAIRDEGLAVSLVNAPPGDRETGEMGLACQPDMARHAASLEEAVEVALTLGAPLVHVLAGRAGRANLSRAADGYALAAERLGAHGLGVVVEAVSPVVAPGYLLPTIEEAGALVRAVGSPNLGLLLDLFHLQVAGGNVLRRYAAWAAEVRHVQLAGAPDRGEPDEGELAMHFVLNRIVAMGYTGVFGCEYRPRGATVNGLGWAIGMLPSSST